MQYVAGLDDEQRKELFQATGLSMGLRPSAAEKDFWVCFMLDHLFNDCKLRNQFVFKGGTSLSKVYHIIERFSEDIDLILDWRTVIDKDDNPWAERSRTMQDKYNKNINADAAKYYHEIIVPLLNDELIKKLGVGEWIEVDPDDEMVVNFHYPSLFEPDYLRPVVRLEIGPLAEWMPAHVAFVESFAAEKYPQVFRKTKTQVLVIDAERTFWEKITILHRIANYPETKAIPQRYARHLYDVYCLSHSWVKASAFGRKELLVQDVTFKQKFYYSRNAHYETASLN